MTSQFVKFGNTVAANVYSFPSVAAAGTDQNKYMNFLERNN